ncbi:hypothetical protein ACIQ4Z_17670 [Peribacillus asahii]|uniref:hypothetical protein n=1 Tax=Peribacillus asahii TaxID=228899 RepID=UPI00382F584E
MIQRVFCFFMLLLLMASSVSAHVVNQDNLYDDIKYSEAADDVVFLSGMGIISYQHGDIVYRPQDPLTRAELARWAGVFFGAADSDATSEEIEKAALKEGIVPSLEGNATYEDVNQAYFKGNASPSNPQDGLMREEFAQFIGSNLSVEIDGKTLYDYAGFVKGPTGVVEKVTETEATNDQGDRMKTYHLHINGEEYRVSEHPRVLNAAVDPLIWEGKSLKESWLSHHQEDEFVIQQFIFTKENQEPVKKEEVNDEKGNVSHDSDEQGNDYNLYLLVGAVILIVGIVSFILIRKRKQHQNLK